MQKGETLTRDRDHLTTREAHFARLVASGKQKTEAYRIAYNVSEGTKARTVHSQACRLAKKPRVAARIDRIIREKERAVTVLAISDRELVTGKLRAWTTGEETPRDALQVRAAELLGRASGMFQDVQPQEPKRRGSDELAQEIADRLKSLQNSILQGNEAQQRLEQITSSAIEGEVVREDK